MSFRPSRTGPGIMKYAWSRTSAQVAAAVGAAVVSGCQSLSDIGGIARKGGLSTLRMCTFALGEKKFRPRSPTSLPCSIGGTARQTCFATDLSTTRSEEHTSELQSLMRSSYAVFCLKKKRKKRHTYKSK